MSETTVRQAPAPEGAPVTETSLVPFSPENVNQAWRLATALAKSQLVPKALQNRPNDLLVTLITGRELGLSPMQSVRGMHVIEGKAVMSADMMGALVMRSEACEFLRPAESTDKIATYETQRKGSPSPTKMSFTIEDANRAGLVGKDNWKRYPAAMLRARCLSAICRAVYPDLVGGVYEPDEAREFDKPERVELKPAGRGRLAALTTDLAAAPRIVEAEAAAVEVPATDAPPANVDPETGEELLNDPADLFAEQAPDEAPSAAPRRSGTARATAKAANVPPAAASTPTKEEPPWAGF